MLMEIEWGESVFRPENGLSTVSVEVNDVGNHVMTDISTVEDFPTVFRDILRDLLGEAIEILGLNEHDRLGLVIHGFTQDGVPQTIGIRMQSVSVISAETVMEQIADKMNSSMSLQFRMRIKFSGIQAVVNQVGGDMHNILDTLSESKKCIVQIHPKNDKFKQEKECLYQFVILGLAFLRMKGKYEFTASQTAKLLDIGIDVKSYGKCTKGGGRFYNRHEFASKLKMIFSCEDSNECLEFFQDYFGVEFVIYDVCSRFRVCYPPLNRLPRESTGNEIFGVLERQKLSHIDFCVNPHALASYGCGRVCENCYELYTRSRTCGNKLCRSSTVINCRKCHTCVGNCGTCFTRSCGKFLQEGEEKTLPFERKKSCVGCHSEFYSALCEEYHQSVCQELKSVKCAFCGNMLHRGLQCNEIRCLQCSEKRDRNDGNHVCYMKRDKLKKPGFNYWTYDFECCLDERNHHQIYLATVWPIYPVEMSLEMKRYSFELMNGYPQQPVFIFWGLEGVKELFQFFTEGFLKGATLFAHNAGRYDAIFVEKYMNEMHGYLPVKLQRGTRIMQMYFEENDLTFKDSLCFIQSTLRAMPANYGIEELRKGFFPHRLMTVDYLRYAEQVDFKVPKPPREIWQHDVALTREGEREDREMDVFLDEFYTEANGLWDLKKDAIEYCISDTVLLGQVLRVFRERCICLAQQIPGDVKNEFDVLQYVTLPSAVMNLFMSKSLPEKTITVIDRYSALMRKEAVEWVVYELRDSLERLTELEYFPSEWDGLVSIISGNTFYCFLPCYDYGCPKCYPSNHRNLRVNVSFYRCFQRYTKLNADFLHFVWVNGYRAVQMWEHDWDRLKRLKEYKAWVLDTRNAVEDFIPLDPRESYKGGVSEMFKIYYPHAFSMADFVSQYPTTMLGFSFSPTTADKILWEMPVGRCERIMFPPISRFMESTRLGIIKCRILAPDNLYAPFLGFRVDSLLNASYEVIYGLCRVCMMTRNDSPCVHSSSERSFTGVWTLNEIRYALSIGYQVLHITEMWEYESRSNAIFKDFIVPFVKTKIISKAEGLVENGEFTEQGRAVFEYLKEMGVIVNPSDFKNAPIDRLVAKLIMNCLYGKFGQRALWPSSVSFSGSPEDVLRCHIFLQDSQIVIESFDLIKRKYDGGEDVVVIMSYMKNYPSSKGDVKKNDIIAAYITAFGREMLNRAIQSVGEDIVYCDTDSILHRKLDSLPYQVGFRFGDLELELPEAPLWVANGRKSYLYQDLKGNNVCKQKGVSLKSSMKDIFTTDNMMRMIEDTTSRFDEIQSETSSYKEAVKNLRHDLNRPSLDVEQVLFQTKRNLLSGEKVTQRSMKKTAFLIEAPKRRIVRRETMIDTLPFGFVNE